METTNVIARLNAVANDLGHIGKREVDQQGAGRFMAFAIDDIYANLRPLFARHGVVMVPSIVEKSYEDIESRSGTKGKHAFVTVEYTFHAPDGSTVTMRSAAEGSDYSDKATNKAVQQAVKYACIQLFQISTGEVDPDAAVVEDVVASPAATATPAEIREKAVKDAAWAKTDPALSTEERIAEAKSIVAQVFESYGGPPKNKSQVEEMVAYIDDITSRVE